jgi:Flp pilus assembly protein TadG
MKENPKYNLKILKCDRGAVIVLVAVILVLLIGITAMAIDLGYRHVVQNELQNVADAAALAATRELGAIYQTHPFSEHENFVANSDQVSQIHLAAINTAIKNQAGKINIVINPADIVIGRWNIDDVPHRINPVTLEQPNAVKVTARRDDAANNPISTFFAGIFGISELTVLADATAALTDQSTAEPGELKLPIGISRSWFGEPDDDFCGKVIKFSPSTDPAACAGWNTFTDDPANDAKVRKILDGTDISPPIDLNDNPDLFFINGNLSENTFEDLMELFQNRGYDVDRIYDPVNSPNNIPKPIYLVNDDGKFVDYDGNLLPEGADPIPNTAADGGGGEASRKPLNEDNDPSKPQLRYPPCTGAGACNGDLRYAHEWPTSVVVYDSDTCTPSGGIGVAGFARVVVYDVGQPSNKVVAARVICNYVDPDPTRGGGGFYGTMGSIPNLVE